MARKKNCPSTALVHPHSRKVRQLERQTRREERINEREKKRNAQSQLEALRFFWFRQQCIALRRTRSVFSSEEAQALTQIYLDRNDDEISSLHALRTSAAGRIKKLEVLKVSETDEFVSSKGICIPDLTEADHVEILTELWDGHADTAHLVPRQRITRGDMSAFTELMVDLKGRLNPIEEVRRVGAAVAPKRTLKFQAESRIQSVKKIATAKDVATRSRKRGAEQQQNRLKKERKAILNARRGI